METHEFINEFQKYKEKKEKLEKDYIEKNEKLKREYIYEREKLEKKYENYIMY